jgi:hypothetical protein
MKPLYYAIIGATALALVGDAYAKRKKEVDTEAPKPKPTVTIDNGSLMAIIYTSRRASLEEELRKETATKDFYIRTCTNELADNAFCTKDRLGLLYTDVVSTNSELQKLDASFDVIKHKPSAEYKTAKLLDLYRERCHKKKGKSTNSIFCQELSEAIIEEEAWK